MTARKPSPVRRPPAPRPDGNGSGFAPPRPFVPVPVAHLDAIEQQLPRADRLAVQAILLALWRIGNRERSHRFSKGIDYVATVAGVHRRTVERHLPALEGLRAVKVTRGALRCAHTYELPRGPAADAAQSRNDAAQSRSVATAKLGDASPPSRTSENRLEGENEEGLKTRGSSNSPRLSPKGNRRFVPKPGSGEEVRDFFETLPGAGDADIAAERAGRFINYNEQHGWKLRDWRLAAKAFNGRCEKTGP